MQIVDFRPRQLPEWFNLARYDACAEWSIGEWCRALEIRSWLHSIALNNWLPDYGPGFSDDTEDYRKLALRLLEDEPKDEYSRVEMLNDSCTSLGRRLVNPLSLQDAYFIYNDFLSGLNGDAGAICSRGEADAIACDFGPDTEEVINLLFASYDERRYKPFVSRSGGGDCLGTAYIAVDLGAPDELLVKQFQECISDMRKKLNWYSHSKTITAEDFTDWHRQRLIPYLDLMIWSSASGVELTYHMIGVALFPSEYNVDLSDRIRRTTKPKAMTLISSATRNALESQYAAMKAGVKNGAA